MVGCQMVLFILQPEGLKFKVTAVLWPAPHMSAKGNKSRWCWEPASHNERAQGDGGAVTSSTYVGQGEYIQVTLRTSVT